MSKTAATGQMGGRPVDLGTDKFVYFFDEGSREMREELGGKGANLAEMTKIGVPVPPGFTITTDVCDYYINQGDYPVGFAEQLQANLERLQNEMGKKLGDVNDPLLVSVRSGAAKSMPGMMDTVLNLGLNSHTVEGLAEKTGNPRFAYDAYRRFIQMFGNVVMEIEHEKFEHELDQLKERKQVNSDTDLEAEDLKELIERYKQVLKDEGKDFPENPLEQLKMAIEAVFHSWNNERAVAYRRINEIRGLKGTAVNIQSMVFGNMGDDSGTGVAFTRNPSTGEKAFYGEFLMNAQGEDVVAGIRTPMAISKLEEIDQAAYSQLIEVKDLLEKHYKDMQDIEFTIERGKLFLLQTRNGKRTAQAEIKVAVDMVEEGLITKKEALKRLDAKRLGQLLHPQLKKNVEREVIVKGLPASPGAACGKVVFTAEDAIAQTKEKHQKVILVRRETSPEDINGMTVAEGVLTARGGMTSHAAVVARGMGKCCITGASELIINVSAGKIVIGDLVVNEGDVITLDGETGEVMLGEIEMQSPDLTGDFKKVMDWADQFRELKVRTNADTPHDCKVAVEFGAEGIGLCRTEHMFFEEDRIHLVRKMILAKDDASRADPLEKLQEIQKDDFVEIFKVMKDRPMTIRLLDPPLHEFLPDKESAIERLADDLGMQITDLKDVIASMHETNPMLGHRGCRLGVTFPEIYKMQTRAITEAAIQVGGVNVEIEVPLVCSVEELNYLRGVIERVIADYGEDLGFNYKIGTMIELPRACLVADELAKSADFFSFGTNDLTQMTYGLSRDDMGGFVPKYIDLGILERDPTASIDQDGVGKLMQICVQLGRGEKPDLEIGICGEQGGDPDSVKFCHEIGLDFVSCSPYRVPVARLAAAQAAIG